MCSLEQLWETIKTHNLEDIIRLTEKRLKTFNVSKWPITKDNPQVTDCYTRKDEIVYGDSIMN